MEFIELKKYDRLEFAKELKEIKIEPIMKFSLNGTLMQNFEILLYHLKNKKIEQVILKEDRNIDPLTLRKFKITVLKSLIYYLSFFKITFEEFLDEELFIILGERNYLNYCAKNNLKPKWNENLLKKEEFKIKHNKHLFKYPIFKELIELQKKTPFSIFNIPKEKGTDRFVFYFNMYSEEEKNKILEFLKNNNLEIPKLVDLISTNKINIEIYYYALGFSYKENELVRVTLYTKFAGKLLTDKDKLKQFLLDKHNLNVKEELKNNWFYAIDFYSDNHEEIKIYDEPHLFKEQLNNVEINSVLYNKHCTKVLKYKNGKLKTIKYEFNLKEKFSITEKKTLKKYDLFKANKNCLAIYPKNGEIVKSVVYEL